MTLRAVAEVEVDDIIEQMHYTRKSFYEKLSTFDTFGKGWTRRNDETKEKALEMAHG
jgi:lysozyme family protein